VVNTNTLDATVINAGGKDSTEEVMIAGSIAMVITVEGRRDTRASTRRASVVTDIVENTTAIEVITINRKFEKSLAMCVTPAKRYRKAAVNYGATSKS
jgi:hypothetical protein